LPDEVHPRLQYQYKPLDAAIGECSHHIAVAAAMVEDFDRKHKTLTKNYF